jgi:hypothetical protein
MTDLLILFEIIASEYKIIETHVYTMWKICEFLCVEASDEYVLCALVYPYCFKSYLLLRYQFCSGNLVNKANLVHNFS